MHQGTPTILTPFADISITVSQYDLKAMQPLLCLNFADIWKMSSRTVGQKREGWGWKDGGAWCSPVFMSWQKHTKCAPATNTRHTHTHGRSVISVQNNSLSLWQIQFTSVQSLHSGRVYCQITNAVLFLATQRHKPRGVKDTVIF